MFKNIQKLNWVKQGLIYCPDGSLPWAHSHAFPPIPHLISSERLRIFIGSCDTDLVSRACYVDVDPRQPSKILKIKDTPILDIGRPGMFDENGVLPTCVLPVGEQLYMYYVGYQLGKIVRYYQFEGLAVSRDGGESFQRIQEVPVLDRSHQESLNRTSSFVLYEDGVFKMWYVGGREWTVSNGKHLPVYNMRYIESADGINWPAGYAESDDGVVWERMDDRIDLDVSVSGWDSEMIAYASIFTFEEKTYMFYNGNSCGKTGFGYAMLKDEGF